MLLKDFWIKKIYVVAYKSESKLHFKNLNRNFDGFVYFKWGKGSFIINGENYEISSGDFILLNKGQNYKFNIDSPCEYYTVAYELGEDKSGVGISAKLLPITFKNQTKLLPFMEELNLYFVNKNLIKCREIISKILIEATTKSLSNSSLKENNIVENALNYICNNYRKSFNVNDIAKHCNISTSYLRSKFRSEVGKSITDYVDYIKINEAKSLLESGFFTIKEISYHLGYFDVYHFTKRFTKLVGVAPGKYKKSFCTKK